MVQRAGRCRFDPTVLRCQGSKSDACLSAAQVAALTRAFNGPVDSHRASGLYVGQAVGSRCQRAWLAAMEAGHVRDGDAQCHATPR